MVFLDKCVISINRVRKTKEIMKISKKVSLLIPETFDLFLKTLAAGLGNSLSEC